MRIVFATNNGHKLEEARRIAGDRMQILSLADIGCDEDLSENATTIEGNSLQKARFVKERFGYDCFSDDTGLFVDALDGQPGVYSARYAGPECDSKANIDKLLARMEGESNRKAHFRTVVTMIVNGEEKQFEGRVDGKISETLSGLGGFGYDPVFIAEENGISFAEMTPEEKNAISHRGRALRKMFDYLQNK